jgi:hypothetical protein
MSRRFVYCFLGVFIGAFLLLEVYLLLTPPTQGGVTIAIVLDVLALASLLYMLFRTSRRMIGEEASGENASQAPTRPPWPVPLTRESVGIIGTSILALVACLILIWSTMVEAAPAGSIVLPNPHSTGGSQQFPGGGGGGAAGSSTTPAAGGPLPAPTTPPGVTPPSNPTPPPNPTLPPNPTPSPNPTP